MGQHRSKEEIEAAKAEQAQAKAERLAERQAKCAALFKLPCLGQCSKGCARRRTERNIAAAKKARRKRDQRLREQSLENRTAAEEAAYQAEVEALAFEAAERKTKKRELRNWKIAVVFVCGFTVEKTRDIVMPGEGLGPVHKAVKDGNLEAVRKGPGRIKKLADLMSKTFHGHDGFVMHWAARSPTPRLHRELQAYLLIKADRVEERRKLRGGGEMKWNPHASALHSEAYVGGIDEHSLQAGVWLSSQFDRIGAGGIRGMNYTGDRIDGGRGDDSANVQSVDALRVVKWAHEHVLAAFRPEMTSEVRWSIVEHVVRYDRPLESFQLPAALGSPVRFLNEALGEIALHKHMAPSGIHSRRPGVRKDDNGNVVENLDNAYEYAARELRDATARHAVIRGRERRETEGAG